MVLEYDLDKPTESQPRFFAKQPTLNQQRILIGVLSSLHSGGELAEKFDAILDAAALLITGWENIPLPFTRENLGDVLSLEEIIEVLNYLVSQSQPTEDDRKKSESPHLSDAASSANPVSENVGVS
jgi:hypothetical protein